MSGCALLAANRGIEEIFVYCFTTASESEKTNDFYLYPLRLQWMQKILKIDFR